MNSTLRSLSPETAERLIAAIQELSLARDLPTVMRIVRRAARELTGADGATFVLKEGTYCFYADEDAISPLWKGSRFPLSSCISGWVMTHRQPAVIEDIYADPRIPIEAYRPTFVKSLAMVPIRVAAPLAAIGNYWSTPHRATDDEVQVLQALANSTSVAMENIALYADLEQRVNTRTMELAAANRALEETNRELEAFAYSASHDLRAPLRTIQGFAAILAEDRASKLSPDGARCLDRITQASGRMDNLIRDLLALAQISAANVDRSVVDLAPLVHEVMRALQAEQPGRQVRLTVASPAPALCDPGLIRIVLENLLANAWKFTGRRDEAHIEFGYVDRDDLREFFVRDNGAGFSPDAAASLFKPFHRLHPSKDFPGVGIGLATVRRIVVKHGGTVRAEGAVNAGATFWFQLPRPEAAPAT